MHRPEPIKIGSYVSGNYLCICHDCGAQFEGDKRALECMPCAIQSVEQLAAQTRPMRKALFMAGAHAQGGNSLAGKVISELLDVPFPLRMQALSKKAVEEGFNPKELWPWW